MLNRFTRAHRLLKSDEFRRVFRSGIRLNDQYFTVIVARQTDQVLAVQNLIGQKRTDQKRASQKCIGQKLPGQDPTSRKPTGSASRLGLAISRKAAPRASDRNRIKRIVRESFRLANPRWQNNNLDLVVMTRQASTQAENGRLFQSLHRHWRRVQGDSRLAPSSPSCVA